MCQSECFSRLCNTGDLLRGEDMCIKRSSCEGTVQSDCFILFYIRAAAVAASRQGLHGEEPTDLHACWNTLYMR